MNIEFEKWHGCKNDFIVFHVDARQDYVISSLERKSKELCLRDGSSVGADGVLIVQHGVPGSVGPHGLTIVNADGSFAQNCGNGLRVAALSSLMKKCGDSFSTTEVSDQVESFVLPSKKVVECKFWPSKNGVAVRVDMGKLTAGEDLPWYAQAKEAVNRLTEKVLKPSHWHLDAWQVYELSNPHLVLFCPEASRSMMLAVGEFLQTAVDWDGINVHVVHTDSKSPSALMPQIDTADEAFSVWVWERGVGPTQACGSGAAAIALFLAEHAMLGFKKYIEIQMPGGSLWVRVSEHDFEAELLGPATLVFRGEITL